ncbi:hypothetical protein ACLB2K_012539 [Fragaria x ananassa]
MSSEKRVITLTSSDGVSFKVYEEVAFQSKAIKNMVEDIGAENTMIAIPLSKITGFILREVIDYCRAHAYGVKESKKDMIADPRLSRLGRPSSSSSTSGLLDLTAQAVADMMKEKNAEEIREHFNIKNDYTPEEEEEVRRENQWAFEEYEEPPAVNEDSEDENHEPPPADNEDPE